MMAKSAGLVLGAWVALVSAQAQAQLGMHAPLSPVETPRIGQVELKLGSYKPLIDREDALNGNKPYETFFGGSPMLLAELEIDRELWQRFGTLSAGFSIGYAEKYAYAVVIDDETNAVTASSERSGLFVLPLRLMALYRFDWPAQHMGIPLVPYAKLALAYTPWWTSKGSTGVEYSNGARGAGGRWGYAGIIGLSFLLDALEPRLAKDFDTDVGINHSYIFAEYVYEEVNNFGNKGFDLSSRRWAFGLSFEF